MFKIVDFFFDEHRKIIMKCRTYQKAVYMDYYSDDPDEIMNKTILNTIRFNIPLIERNINYHMGKKIKIILNAFIASIEGQLVFNLLLKNKQMCGSNKDFLLYKKMDYLYELRNNIDIFDEININNVLVDYL